MTRVVVAQIPLRITASLTEVTEPEQRLYVDLVGSVVLDRARVYVGRRTTVLLATGRKQPADDARGPAVDVVFGRQGRTPYLGYHHDGTPPHMIYPRRARVLRFMQGGEVRYARSVRHPGTPGTRFLTRAIAPVGI